MPEPPDSEFIRGHMDDGILIAGACNLAGLVITFYLMFFIGPVFPGGFGLVQFAWLYPIWRRYKKKGKTESAKGVLVIAGITFLLNATCWGVFGMRGNRIAA
jgi:hypothetical protein